MLQLRIPSTIQSVMRTSTRSIGKQFTRAYHSYPSPNEKPEISTFIAPESRKPKTLRLDEKFRTDKLFPGVNLVSGDNSSAGPLTLSTVLPNGLTVASQDVRGLMSSFIVLVKSGSGDEIQDGSANDNSGVTQALELSAFQTTPTRSAQDFSSSVERLGGMVQCISSRENIIYCIDALRCNAEEAVDLLADCVLNPVFMDDELEDAKAVIGMVQDSLPADQASRDALSMAAYKHCPMGNHHFCSDAAAARLTPEILRQFRGNHFVASNMIVAGAGIEHDRFLDIVSRKFANASNKKLTAARKPSTFAGGIYLNERPLKEPFTKVAIGFEFCKGWNDNDVVTGIVLQSLLGGGSSFSAGGPGKGMYTRLYREVLNQHHWVESAEAIITVSDDSGMIAIDGACPADNVDPMIQVIMDQFLRLKKNRVDPIELIRAKNMAKSTMLMQLESRLVVAEDIARQFSTFYCRKNVMETCAKIDAVTAEDLQRIVRNMLNGPPAVSAVGPELAMFPPYDIIQRYIKSIVEAVK